MKGADSVGRWRRLLPVVAVALAAGVLTTSRLVEAQRSGAGKSVNWPLHNLDVFGGRFSTLDQITRSNVKTLTPRWLFQYGIIDGVSNLILSLGLPKPKGELSPLHTPARARSRASTASHAGLTTNG